MAEPNTPAETELRDRIETAIHNGIVDATRRGNPLHEKTLRHAADVVWSEVIAPLAADRDKYRDLAGELRDVVTDVNRQALAARATIAEAREFHRREETPNSQFDGWCGTCNAAWPCRTAVALGEPASDGDRP